MDSERPESDSAGPAPSSAAAFAALAYASREKADAFLDEQTRLAREQAEVARLQADDIRRDDSLRHWSFIVRHISDVVKVTFEVALAILVIAIVAGLTSVVWAATHDDSLVIEAFSVPPDLAARGLTGQAVAAQLQDKLASMQNATDSSRPEKSYANNWDDGIKVMIPDTGISIGDLYRTLAGWLGHQTHITGEVYRTPTGIAITARSNGAGGTTATGTEADFDALLQQSAEAIYQHTQPYRYTVYLASTGRMAQAMPLYLALASGGDREDRLWAHMGISSAYELSRPYDAPAENRKSLAIKPDFVLAWQNISAEEVGLGHPGAGLAALRAALDLYKRADGQLTARAFAISWAVNQGNADYLLGDCQGAAARYGAAAGLTDYAGMVDYSRMMQGDCLARLHDPSAAREAWANISEPVDVTLNTLSYYSSRIETDASLGDWRAVLADDARTRTGFAAFAAKVPPIKPGLDAELAVQIQPFAALARAQTGDMSGAQALIDATPRDCYDCLRVRGILAAMRRHWEEAAAWFAKAAAQSPAIPFAFADWGAMLLGKGNLDGAIAKFDAAHKAGPRFADPLEMWGEALIVKNRSDLALAKFEEAARDAPNWGRLHLKWGEALLWLGRKDDAAKQFALAASLDLSPAEKAQLGRFAHV
ncbi:MAG: hypothetical protein JSR60_14510 [Proteobacteria bacterium]|nr:hypothetical protein [Pseudomonadota bacterium]